MARRFVVNGYIEPMTAQCPCNQASDNVAKSKIAAPVACVRKYFVVASVARG